MLILLCIFYFLVWLFIRLIKVFQMSKAKIKNMKKNTDFSSSFMFSTKVQQLLTDWLVKDPSAVQKTEPPLYQLPAHSELNTVQPLARRPTAPWCLTATPFTVVPFIISCGGVVMFAYFYWRQSPKSTNTFASRRNFRHEIKDILTEHQL